MIGFLVNMEVGYVSMIFYLLVYLFMNLGGFICVILFFLCIGID